MDKISKRKLVIKSIDLTIDSKVSAHFKPPVNFFNLTHKIQLSETFLPAPPGSPRHLMTVLLQMDQWTQGVGSGSVGGMLGHASGLKRQSRIPAAAEETINNLGSEICCDRSSNQIRVGLKATDENLKHSGV